MDDLIPEDYTLIDVAYYYHWKKDAPMKFFYRIFKKNRVLLKRRKRKLEAEESATTDTSANDAKMSRTEEQNGKGVGSVVQEDGLGGRDQSVDIRSCSAPTTKNEDSVKPSKEEESVKLQPSVSTSESSVTKNVTMFTGENKDVVKKDESKWSYTPPLSSDSKVEAKSDPEPVKMETDEPEEKKKPAEPVREVKIISLLGPGKTSIVSETIKKPETKENDAPDANASQNVAAVPASPTEKVSTDVPNATNGETKSSDPKNKSEDKIGISNTSSNVTKVTPTTMSSPSQQKSRKPGNGSQILSVINNLTKKQQNLEAASKDMKVPTVIHGQTTITKRVVENGSQLNGSSSSTAASAATTTSSSATTAATAGNLPHTSHHIPSGTTITVKQVASASASPKTNTVSTPNGKSLAPTPGTINSNSSIQTPKPMISTNGTSSATPPSPLSNIKPKPAVADLRQYRKCPPTSEGSTASPLTLSRPPIVPQLTLSGRVKSQGAGTITTASNHHQQQQLGSHRLPASTSAGIASSRPLSLSGNSIGRLPTSFSSAMSTADQQKALQMLRMPISSMTTTKSPTSSSPSTTTGSSSPSHSTISNMASSVTAAQLPSNRLQLKVQPPTAGISPFQAAFQSSLYSHLASESLWKCSLLGQTPTTTQSGSPTSKSPTTNGKSMNSSLPKTLNQGIRQIPNPSLLAKQQAEQYMMAMAAAHFVSNANAKTSPKQ